MKLELLTYKRPDHLISYPKDVKELWDDINTYLIQQNFKSYYKRYWIDDGRLIIDFGSHTKLFAISDMTIGDMKDLHVEGLVEGNN